MTLSFQELMASLVELPWEPRLVVLRAVWLDTQLAYYFRLDFDVDKGKGTIAAEALFYLNNFFPDTDLVITERSDYFLGIVGNRTTAAARTSDGTILIYNLTSIF